MGEGYHWESNILLNYCMRNKRFTLFLLALLFAQFSFLHAQQTHYTLTPAQSELRPVDRSLESTFSVADHPLPGALNIQPEQAPRPEQSSKTQAEIQLGTSSNIYTTLRPQQNQIIAIDSLQTIAFIHRQDIALWGGQAEDNGRFRYDISTDGGDNWALDVGYLQQLYTNYGRYPNIAAYNPNASANPLDLKFVYGGPTTRFPLPGWVGHVYGVSDVSATPGATVSATDNYLLDSDPTSFIQGSMVQGLPGEFWMVENEWDAGTEDILDSIRILKGTWNSNTSDVDWALYQSIYMDYDKTFDGSPIGTAPVMAFSPDGMHGWIAMTGNILNGTDTRTGTFMPIFLKSSDGGATWDPAFEVNLNNIPWMSDSLAGPIFGVGSGIPMCLNRNFDLTVDKFGVPHFGAVIYNADSVDSFNFFPGLEKFLADVFTTDGGVTWDASYMAPILTYDNSYGTTPSPVSLSNHVQAARTESGSHIFFSWVDSDTSQFTGSMNGVGFGESVNLAPNLRIVAKRASDAGQSYPRTITDPNLNWSGSILFPTMSPIVIEKAGKWHLPIVATDLISEPGNPVGFYYWGNDATFDIATTEFCLWPSMDLGWVHWGDPSFVPVNCITNTDNGNAQTESVIHTCFPNPTAGDAIIRFELKEMSELDVSLVNIYGQTVAELAQGEFNAGRHDVRVNTDELATGIYFYRIQTSMEGVGSEVFTGKLMIKQ